ncbi:uncharacterized protein SOCE26_074240 [Sorangium cellulosum]|uniref:Uncharacterized protein n=1 Tax=Sorangium cellulosum TaxID=56 RepID=A0A2L0F2Y4_SORCE|nr:uncharacterized protein SOCE26_074240 [Sorangium cellulosum]
MRKPSGRTARAVVAAAVVSAGGIAIVACNTALGIGDFKFEECERGALSCANNMPRICNERGQWENKKPECSNMVCVNGECQGECAPGQKRCAGITPQQCDSNGKWQDGELCDTGTRCSGGACVATCAPGDLQCSRETPQLCDPTGQWRNDGDTPCRPGYECDPFTGACSNSPRPIAECSPGTTRCAGTTPQQCDANGEWKNQDPCRTGTHCLGGACVATCAPGDLQCSGNQPQRCNSVGEWEKNGDACGYCVGCDDSTARCAIPNPARSGGSCKESSDCIEAEEYCCNGACLRLRNIGDPCADANECASRFCVDGRCCDTACSGVCQACNIAGSEGTCSIPVGAMDPIMCTERNFKYCSYTGECAKTNGVGCGGDSECVSGYCGPLDTCEACTDTCPDGQTCMNGTCIP